MRRILIVLQEGLDRETLRMRCTVDGAASAASHEIAVCLVLAREKAGLADVLRAQRDLTRLLREALGDRAEGVAVLVASDSDGYRVEDCAREWGATEVLV